MRHAVIVMLASVVTAGAARGQATQTASPESMEEAAGPATQPAPDFARTKLTGDWGGLRTDLAEHGITLDFNLTQTLQGNAHGGASTNNGLRYAGSGDLTLKLDFGKLDLWPGGSLLLNAEPKWGDGINSKVGSLIPVNMDAIKPGFGEGAMFTLSEWIYTQVLFDGKLVLIGGKLDGSRAFDRNMFANDERTQFLNLALRNNPMIGSFLPYTDIGAGFIVNPTDWLSIISAAADSEGRAKTTGFGTTFHGPTHTTVIHEWALTLKPFDLEGHQRFGFAWTSREFSHLQPLSPFKDTAPMLLDLLGPALFNKVGGLLPFDTSADNAMLYYNFDQYLYTEPDDPTQGIGVFGRFGWARDDINPIHTFYSLGLGGKGILPERDNDTFGVGYYHLNLSDQLPPQFHSEQGVECYYNIEITPWLHVSPDLQVVVNPGGTDLNDVSLVYGLRLQMDL